MKCLLSLCGQEVKTDLSQVEESLKLQTVTVKYKQSKTKPNILENIKIYDTL